MQVLKTIFPLTDLQKVLSRAKCWFDIIFKSVEKVRSGHQQLLSSLQIDFHFSVGFHLNRILIFLSTRVGGVVVYTSLFRAQL